MEAGVGMAKQVTETQPLTIQQLVKKMKLHMKMLQRTKQKVYTPAATAVKLRSFSSPNFHKKVFQSINQPTKTYQKFVHDVSTSSQRHYQVKEWMVKTCLSAKKTMVMECSFKQRLLLEWNQSACRV